MSNNPQDEARRKNAPFSGGQMTNFFARGPIKPAADNQQI